MFAKYPCNWICVFWFFGLLILCFVFCTMISLIGVSTSETTTVPDLLSKVVEYMLDYFDSANIFYAAGNYDGQHDEIFCSGSDPKKNAAWENVLIDNKIVNNDLGRKYTVGSEEYSQTQLFGETGHYVERIPSVFDFYVIILNTNLGASNSIILEDIMPLPRHIQTQVQSVQQQQQQEWQKETCKIGQGGTQFGDLNVGQLSKEVQNGIMPLRALNN